jgi:AraC-like DNA-binding protein
MQADTLHKALALFIADMGQQSNCPAFWLEEQAQGLWFYRLGTQGIKKGQWPIEQHVVSMMIQLVRGFTSKKWTPPAVHLQTHTLKGAQDTPSFKNSNVIISKPYTGILIPQAILPNKPLSQEELNVRYLPVQQENISGINSKVLKVIIAQSNYKVTYSAEHAAKSLGISVRQMQRLLKYEKTSFRELTEQVLLKQAQLMLAGESMSIIDIAIELGYTDAGNFTRAFKRWSGMSPSLFRQTNSDNC